MIMLLYSRTLNLLGTLTCFALLACAFYLEYAKNLDPCSLCILQRFAFLLLAVLLGVAFLHNPKRLGTRLYGLFTLFISILGVLTAGRQVWLQLQPHAPAKICMPGFSYIVTHLPLNEAISSMIMGSDNCGVVTWTFFHLSIAGWSLLWFSLFCLLGILQMFVYRR